MTNKEQIKQLFKELKPSEARDLANWLQKEYNYTFDWYKLKATDEMKEIARRIFELCPQANCIPVAYNDVDECDYFTEYENYDEVMRCAENELYLENGVKYQMPYFDDEMKKKEWDEIEQLMKKLHDSIRGENTHENGDYCSYSHLSFFVFSKEKNDFIETEEIG